MAGPGVRREDASRDAGHGDAGGGDADHPTALPGAITLPGEERMVATGRRFVRETLGHRHPALDEVVLGVSELATNAIKHTPSGDGGEITISLATVGPVIRAEVTNEGSEMPTRPRRHVDVDAEDGRGILIVEALAEAWGVTEHAGTTTVWAEFWADGSPRSERSPNLGRHDRARDPRA
jgi:anti-sigma regulatory factor (Ser/Thr protein kinase)